MAGFPLAEILCRDYVIFLYACVLMCFSLLFDNIVISFMQQKFTNSIRFIMTNQKTTRKACDFACVHV